MVTKFNDLQIANMNGIALFCRTNTRTLIDFIATVNQFALMAQYGGCELEDEEIVYLTKFWEAK